MLAFLLVLAPALAAVISNAPSDVCTTATSVSDGGYTSSDARSTIESSCIGNGVGVYFLYNATCTGNAIVRFSGKGSESIKAVTFAGSTCATLGSELHCTNTRFEIFQFPVKVGQAHYFAVGVEDSASELSLNVRCYPLPDNDVCDRALSITDGVTLSHNVGAGRHTCIKQADVFFKYWATCTGTAVVDFTAAGDIEVIFEGSRCETYGGESSCTQYIGLSPRRSFSVTRGESYYLAVGASSVFRGDINVTVQCTRTRAPSNDLCNGSISITDGVITQGDNTGASNKRCEGQAEIFFNYVASCTGFAIADFWPATAGSLVTGSGSSCQVFQSCPQFHSNERKVRAQVTLGQTIYFFVGADSIYRGIINVKVQCFQHPKNNICEGARSITDGTTEDDNTYAPDRSNTYCTWAETGLNNGDVSGYLSAYLFYSYTATCTGLAVISVNAPGNPRLRANSLEPCSSTHWCSYALPFLFDVRKAEKFNLVVGASTGEPWGKTPGTGWEPYRGPFNVTMECVSAAANDLCEGAMNITDGLTESDNTYASIASRCPNQRADIFFYYTATCTGTAVASFRGTNNARLVVGRLSEGCSSNAVCLGASQNADLSFAVASSKGYYLVAGSQDDSGYRGKIHVTMTCFPYPANDLCDGALNITDGKGQGDNTYARSQGECANVDADLFYYYTATCTGVALAWSRASGTGNRLATAVRQGSCISGPVCPLGSTPADLPADLYFNVTARSSYYVVVGSPKPDYWKRAYRGKITVTIECLILPVNHVCAGAMHITDGLTQANNAGAPGASLFYYYKATCTGNAVGAFRGEGYADLFASVFSDSCLANADFRTENSEFSRAVAAGQGFYFVVGSYKGWSRYYRGNINVTMQCFTPPANDVCSNATNIIDGTITGDNTNSSRTSSGGCSWYDLFYYFKATCTGTTTASFWGTGNATLVVGVLSGSCSSRPICSDRNITFQTQAGSGYYLVVGPSFSLSAPYFGKIYGTVSCLAAPPNDRCMAAVSITDGLTQGSNVGARSSQQALFYNYTATCTGTAVVSLRAPENPSLVVSKFPTPCYWDAICSPKSTLANLSWDVNKSSSYHLAVGSGCWGYSGGNYQGSMNLTMACFTAPRNDVCEGAVNISDGVNEGDNTYASNTPHSGCRYLQADLFYYYTATCTGRATVSVSAPGNPSLVTAILSSSCASTRICSLLATADVARGTGYYVVVASGDKYRGRINVTMECVAAPANDLCVGALNITDGLSQGSNSGASAPSQSGCREQQADLFYHYIATCTGIAVASFCGTGNALLVAGRLPGVCTTNASFCTAGSMQPRVSFNVTAGSGYYLVVGSFGNSAVSYRGDINVTMVCVVPPANAVCASATNITDGMAEGDNSDVGIASGPCLKCDRADLFFYYTATCTGTVTATFRASENQVLMAAVLAACSPTPSFASALQSVNLTMDVTAGSGYYLVVGPPYTGTPSYRGKMYVSMTCLAAPPNDRCTGAVSITDGLTQGSNVGARTVRLFSYQQALFFNYTATCTGTAVVSLRAPENPSLVVSMLSACPSSATFSYTSPYANLSFDAIAGKSYYLTAGSAHEGYGALGYRGGYTGSMNLTLTCTASPLNDVCAGAVNISDGVTEADNTNASNAGQSGCYSRVQADLFFYYIATCTGFAKASVNNSSLFVALLSGSCSSIKSGCTNCATGWVKIEVTAGNGYYVAVGSRDQYRGRITLAMECFAAPSNDVCSGALVITNGVTAGGNNFYASPISHSGCEKQSADLFYVYTATCTGIAVASFRGTGNPSLVVGRLSGLCGSSPICSTAESRSDFYSKKHESLPNMTFDVKLNNSYYLVAGGDQYGSYRGPIDVIMECFAAAPNDLCTGAMNITDGLTVANNTYASCAAQSGCLRQVADIFFYYTATCRGTAVVTFSSEAQLVAAKFSSLCSSPLCTDGYSNRESFEFSVVQFQGYHLSVGSAQSWGYYYRGPINVSIECLSAPANDECSGAVNITDGVVEGDNTHASTASLSSCTNQQATLFYYYTASCTGIAVASFRAPGNPSLVAARLSGVCASSAVCSPASTHANLSFNVTAFSGYFMVVGASDSYRGKITVAMQCLVAQSGIAPPTNETDGTAKQDEALVRNLLDISLSKAT